MKKFRRIFDEYEKLSDKTTDYFIQSIEARCSGKTGLAIYLETRIIPPLRQRCYKLAIQLQKEAEKLQ